MAHTNIYASRADEIIDLVNANDIVGLAKLTAKMARQLNQRYRRLEEKLDIKEIGDSSSYQFSKREQDTDNPRYSENYKRYEEWPITDIRYQALNLNTKLMSRTSTVRGLKQVRKKWMDNTIKGLEEKGIVIDDKDKFIEFMQNGGADILESKNVDPYIIFETWRDYVQDNNVTNKELIESFENFKDKGKDTYKLFKDDLMVKSFNKDIAKIDQAAATSASNTKAKARRLNQARKKRR